jgi:high-affinity nickel permease
LNFKTTDNGPLTTDKKIMTPTLIATLGLGFVLGLKHALDADHIVAVSTIVSEHKSISKSSLIGTFWGIGHTASLLIVGLLVGLVHGLAGSATLMLLVLTTIPSPLAGFFYILIFGLGSVGGMLIMSSLISLPFVLTANKLMFINEGIKVLAGVSSIGFGIFLGWQIGFVEGLFL